MMGVNTRNMQSCLQKCNKLCKSHLVGQLLNSLIQTYAKKIISAKKEYYLCNACVVLLYFYTGKHDNTDTMHEVYERQHKSLQEDIKEMSGVGNCAQVENNTQVHPCVVLLYFYTGKHDNTDTMHEVYERQHKSLQEDIKEMSGVENCAQVENNMQVHLEDAGFKDAEYIQVNSDMMQWQSLSSTSVNNRNIYGIKCRNLILRATVTVTSN